RYRRASRTLSGLLRADGNGNDATRRADAEAGAGGGDARRGEVSEARSRDRHARVRQVGRLRGARRRPADGHLERQEDRLGLDRWEPRNEIGRKGRKGRGRKKEEGESRRPTRRR